MRKFIRKFKETGTLLVALIALFFSFWMGHEQRKHNHISVEPRISAYFTNDGDKGKWGLYIYNSGMGTAYIKNLEVFVDKKPVSEKKYDDKLYTAVLELNLNPMCFLIGQYLPNNSIPVEQEGYLITAKKNFEGTELQYSMCAGDRLKLMISKKRLDFRLKIESIYGYEYLYQFSNNTQTKI